MKINRVFITACYFILSILRFFSMLFRDLPGLHEQLTAQMLEVTQGWMVDLESV